jgi:YD repeat-containing protein
MGNLTSLFPSIQPGSNYRFDFSVTGMLFDIKIFSRTTIQTQQNIKVGGLRVKKVSIKDGVDEANTIVKTYRYTNLSNTEESSGVLYNYPRYWLNLDNFATSGNGQLLYTYFNSTAFFDYSVVPLSGFEGGHIGYSTVTEDYEGNGRKEFVFFTETPSIGLGSTYGADFYPYPPEQLRVIAGNLDKSSTWREDNIRLELTTNGFLDAPYTDTDGVMVKAVTIPIPGQGTFMWQLYRIKTRIPYLVDVSEYDLDGVVKTTTYEYNGINLSDPLLRHYFPTAVQFNNSDGKVYRTETSYAPELSESALTSRYMIGIPVKETQLVNGSVVGGYRKAYNGDAYPIRYYEILQGGGELQRGEITGYNAQGLPNNFIPMGFSQVNYQWGANRMLTRQDFLNWRKNWDHYEQTTGGGKTRFLKEATDIDGLSTQYQYDQLGRLIRMSSRNDNIVTRYFYNYGGPNSVVSVTEYTDAPTQTIEGCGSNLMYI